MLRKAVAMFLLIGVLILGASRMTGATHTCVSYSVRLSTFSTFQDEKCSPVPVPDPPFTESYTKTVACSTVNPGGVVVCVKVRGHRPPLVGP